MTRAQQAALNAYPDDMGTLSNVRYLLRTGFEKGYQQAEKDLALTWEDIAQIYEIVIATDCEFMKANVNNDYNYDEEEMYKEALKRFNETKK